MRSLRYNLAPTLNGVIASLPFHTTPWIVEDPTIDFPALYAQFGTIIMGRRTYEAFLSMGGDTNPLATLAKEDVVVFTRGLDGEKAREWSGKVTIVTSDGEAGVIEAVVRLKNGDLPGGGERRGGEKGRKKKEKDIWLMGGGELAGLLMRAGLVDVVEAAIMPVVVPEGVMMFGEAGRNTGAGGDYGSGSGNNRENGWKLKLEKAEALESGILMTRYKVLYD